MTEAVVDGPAVEPTTPPAEANTPVVENQPQATPNEPTIATEEAPKAWFADDWREKIAGEDTKALDRLRRFSDPMAMWNSYRQLEGKVSSGQVKMGLPENPTDEQVAQYRKDNGIPAAVEDYKIDLPEGVVIGEDDQPVLGHVLQALHAGNVPNEVASQIVNSYLEAQEFVAAEKAEQQKAYRSQAEETLRQKWGNNYRPSLNAVQNLLAGAPKGVAEMIDKARLPDGSLAGNNPEILSWLASLAFDINPAGTVVPGASGNQLQAIDAELKELSAMRKKDINGWHKNLDAKKRERELFDAKAKLQSRGY